MFTRLSAAPPDPLWALTAAFHADPRPHKMDLGIGIYRDDNGVTPVLMSVRAVEERLAASAPSKAYRPLSGNAAFNAGIAELLLGAENAALERTVTIQTLGGTGALRMLGELVVAANPGATVWVSDPGYVNHRPLMVAAGLATATYPWQEHDGVVDSEAIMAAFETAREGDILLVQGCCHNPTGVDLSIEGWRKVADLCDQLGLVPLVDIAYQGLGDGLDSDACGLRLLVERLDTVLIAASCSKNMGLYCERTGAALAIVPSTSAFAPTRSVLEGIGRRTYSMPPEHGAAIATALFAEPIMWLAELDRMRERIRTVRTALTSALRRVGAPNTLQSLLKHRGMFSTLPFSLAEMASLRDNYAIYGTSGGRINLAGIPGVRIDDLAQALAEVAVHGAIQHQMR